MSEAFLETIRQKTGGDFENPVLDTVCSDPDNQSLWNTYGFVWRQYTTFKWLPWFVEQYAGNSVMVVLNWDTWDDSSFAGMLFYANFGPSALLTMGFSGGSNDNNWGSCNTPALKATTYTYGSVTYDVYDTQVLSEYRQSWSPLRILVW